MLHELKKRCRELGIWTWVSLTQRLTFKRESDLDSAFWIILWLLGEGRFVAFIFYLFIYFLLLTKVSSLFYFPFFLNFILFFKLYIIVLVLPNIKMNPPRVYMCSPSWTLLPPPSPHHPSGSSQCTSPKHPVSCIEPGLATRFIHDILHVSMSFSQIFPPSPSLTESIRLFYTSVSLLLSHTQGYCYHSKICEDRHYICLLITY